MAVILCLLFVDLSWVVLWCSKFDTLQACVRSKVHKNYCCFNHCLQTHTTKRRDHLGDLGVVVMRGVARGWGTIGAFPSGGKINISK
jgi:hypothetical protein